MIRLVFAAALLTLSSLPAGAEEILHRPLEAEPGTLDPQKMTEAESIAIDRDLFVGLATLSAGEKVVPGAAESWDVSLDRKVWTFHLRRDAKWSNGDKLTADDFLYTFRRLVDPKSAAADPTDIKQVVNAEEIVAGKEKDISKLGVEVVDPYTLRVTLKEPRVAFPFILTDPQLFPLHRATLEKWGADWTRPEHMVSNGAYVLKSWTPQAEIRLEKSPSFFAAKDVKIGDVRWLNASDQEAGFRRYRAGELDYIGLTKEHLPWARQNLKDELHTADTNLIFFMFFNMKMAPLGTDARLREALNLAVDRDVIVKHVDDRGEQAAYGLMPPAVTGFTDQTMWFKDHPMAERLAKAKELLAAAGYGPNHPLEVNVQYPTLETFRQILLAIRQMWQPLGVRLTLDNMEWQVFNDVVNQRRHEIGMMSALGSYDDYENGLDNYRSDAKSANWCDYSNPKFDDLFHRGSVATDMDTRRHLMEQAEKTVVDDYAVIPLEYGARNVLVNPKLEGFVPHVIYNQSRYLSFKGSAS